MQTNIWKPYAQFVAFDYAHMAHEADACRDSLQARLKERKARGPSGLGGVRVWEWENRTLYAMYLEQRSLAKELHSRAARL